MRTLLAAARGAAKGTADMGDRFGRRNRMVDEAVDVDAAVVPAPVAEPEPPPPEPEPEPEPEAAATEPVGADEPDEELEEVDARFARRNPIVDRALSEPGES